MSELILDDDEETVNLANAIIILVIVRFWSVLRETASFCVGSRLPAVS